MSQDLLVHVFVVAGWTKCCVSPLYSYQALMQIINHIFIFSIKVCAAESYLQSAQSGECPRTKRDRGELAWDRYRYHYPECSNYSGRVMGRISEHSLDISCWSLRSVR